MLEGQPVIAVVPARGGSKGIPRKNLVTLGGRTLLARAIEVAQAVDAIDRIIVSTEDPEIRSTALSAGAEVHHRPPELAADTSLVAEALRHLADTMLDGGYGSEDPILVLLEPTCPFRTAEDIDECLEVLEKEGCDSVATFTEAAVNPLRTWTMEEGRPRPFIPGADPWQPRQALDPAYQLSGVAYVFRRSALRDPKRPILSGDMRGVVLTPARSFDIDSPLDLKVAQAMLEEA
jgi:CMP-N-acetylneuraminic acid synthetase